jgi:HSP20 family protein
MIPSPFHGIFSSAVGSDDSSLLGRLKSKETKRDEPAKQPAAAPSQAKQSGVGQVALDIFEYDNYYIIKAPIAGVRLSDIDIDISDNTVAIRGARRQTDTIPDDQYYIKECFWGEFERKVTLPCVIDPRKVKATFNKECVLKVLVPKEEKVKIIRIND